MKSSKHLVAIFVGAPILFYSFIVVFPLFFTIYISFTEWEGVGEPVFIGIQNYAKLFNDRTFLVSLSNNLTIFGAEIVFRLTISFFLALIIYEKIKGWQIFRNIFFLPTVMSMAIIGMMWRIILDPISGPINEFGRTIGWGWLAQAQWLYDKYLALPTVIFVGLWRWIGFTMVIFLGGLQTINPEFFDAAKVDGASWWKTVRHIVIPLLAPIFALNFILLWSHAMKIFDIIWVMTAKAYGPFETTSVITTYLFVNAFRFKQFGYASAIASILLLITSIVGAIQLRLWSGREKV
ncbi:MAG: sugar ABC transporter permease [Nitrososphaeria archaeon]